MPSLTQALIFAAGFGKRLRPLTDHTPKPLIPIGDTTCLDFAIQHITEAGIHRIVVNTHHLAEQIHRYLSNLSSSDLFRGSNQHPKIILSHEPEILETGGGLVNALPHFNSKEPILIVNGDIWWQEGSVPMLKRLQDAWNPDTMDILLLLVQKKVSIGYYGKGDYFLNDDQRAEYRGQKDAAPYVYPGVCIINPTLSSSDLFRGSNQPPKAFSIKAFFDQAESNKRLFGLVHDNLWGDIGSPQGLTDVRKACDYKKRGP